MGNFWSWWSGIPDDDDDNDDLVDLCNYAALSPDPNEPKLSDAQIVEQQTRVLNNMINIAVAWTPALMDVITTDDDARIASVTLKVLCLMLRQLPVGSEFLKIAPRLPFVIRTFLLSIYKESEYHDYARDGAYRFLDQNMTYTLVELLKWLSTFYQVVHRGPGFIVLNLRYDTRHKWLMKRFSLKMAEKLLYPDSRFPQVRLTALSVAFMRSRLWGRMKMNPIWRQNLVKEWDERIVF